jgi:hypothetical protein
MLDVDPTLDRIILCMHSTRRTRRIASTGASENPCDGCTATVLLHPSVRPYAQAQGIRRLYLLCPSCFIKATPPDALIGGEPRIPGMAEYLERRGLADGTPIEDGEAYLDELATMTAHDYARNVLKATIGGDG